MIMRLTDLVENKKNWNILISFTLLISIGWVYLSRIPEDETTGGAPPPSPREGFSAPGFTLEVLNADDTEINTSLSQYRGQVVMINFWATWCPPCREEMPAIQSVYEDYKESDFVVLAINTTFQDNEADVQAFVNEYNLTFPILLDRTGDVSQQYQLRGLPSTYFVDRKGVIQAVIVGGPMNETLIRSRIANMLKEAP